MKSKFLVHCILFIAITFTAFSQSLKVSSDTNNVLIGDWITLNIQYLSNKKVDVMMPILDQDSIKGIEIINESKVDTVKNGTTFGLSKSYTISAYDSGSFVIPRLSAYISDKDKIDTVYSDSSVLVFVTPPVDTTKAIKDIKGIYSVNYTDNTWIYVILVVLILIVLIYFSYKYYKKRKQNKMEEIIDYDPNIPPYILAMESLRKIEQERLWQDGKFKKYYSEITDILRIYYHRIYGIKTKELTSRELLNALEGQELFDSNSKSMLEYISQYSDLSKFAKANPLPENNTQSIKFAFELVEKGKPLSDKIDEGDNVK